MASIVAIVNAMSDRLTANLAAKGYPVLAKGKIVMGRHRQYELDAPPRVIMTPTKSGFGGPDGYSRAPAGAEGRAQHAQRSIATEFVRFEVRCWGAQPDRTTHPDTVQDDDFDFTQTLYHAVIQAAAAPTDDSPPGPAVLGPLTKGGVELDGGTWTDATFQSAQGLLAGREFVFGISVPVPVTDTLLAYAPSDVTAVTKTYLGEPGSEETTQGCGEDTP